MSLREDLIAAKALIDTPEKWGKDWHHTGPMCALRAVQEILGGAQALVINQPLYQAVCEALPADHTAHYGRHSIGKFNDHPRTTHADIMALFDRAINAVPPLPAANDHDPR